MSLDEPIASATDSAAIVSNPSSWLVSGTRELSVQFNGDTAFLFDAAAATFRVDNVAVCATRRCFARTAVFVEDVVIAAGFGTLSVFGSDGNREEKTSVLGQATRFVSDPADTSRLFVHFAAEKEVYVADKNLQFSPYLADVEAFDVSARYFASIETGGFLFVRGRDGSDVLPPIQKYRVAPGSVVFCDDTYAYVLDPRTKVVEKIEVDTFGSETIRNVVAVWSTGAVVLQLSDGKLKVGDTELKVPGSPSGPLAVAVFEGKFALWTSVNDDVIIQEIGESEPLDDFFRNSLRKMRASLATDTALLFQEFNRLLDRVAACDPNAARDADADLKALKALGGELDRNAIGEHLEALRDGLLVILIEKLAIVIQHHESFQFLPLLQLLLKKCRVSRRTASPLQTPLIQLRALFNKHAGHAKDDMRAIDDRIRVFQSTS
jgi:hypothetical protein